MSGWRPPRSSPPPREGTVRPRVTHSSHRQMPQVRHFRIRFQHHRAASATIGAVGVLAPCERLLVMRHAPATWGAPQMAAPRPMRREWRTARASAHQHPPQVHKCTARPAPAALPSLFASSKVTCLLRKRHVRLDPAFCPVPPGRCARIAHVASTFDPTAREPGTRPPGGQESSHRSIVHPTVEIAQWQWKLISGWPSRSPAPSYGRRSDARRQPPSPLHELDTRIG